MASDVIVVHEKRAKDKSCHRILFNDLIGAARYRNGNVEFFGGFCIDEQLELSTLLDWQIGWRELALIQTGSYRLPAICEALGEV